MGSTLQDISFVVNQKMVAYINEYYGADKGVLSWYTLQQELPLKLTTEENNLFQSLVAKPYGTLYEVTFKGVTVVESWLKYSSYNSVSYIYLTRNNDQQQVTQLQIMNDYYKKLEGGGNVIDCHPDDWEFIQNHTPLYHIYDHSQLCLVKNTLLQRFLHRYGGALAWAISIVFAIICAIFLR